MKFFGITCVATSFVAMASAQGSTNVDDKIQSGALCAGGNTDASIGSKQVYISYPGFENIENDKNYFLKVTSDKNYNHEINIPSETQKTGGTIRLALDNASAGKYGVQSCWKNSDNTGTPTCSPVSKPLKDIDMGEKATMDCALHDATIEQITLKPIQKFYTKMDTIKASNASYAYMYQMESYKVYKMIGMEKTYSIYVAFEYDLKQFKQFYASNNANNYCKRKYNLVILLHLVDKETKEIKHQFRFTPKPLTYSGEKTFVLAPQGPEAPIEVLVKTPATEDKKITGSYTLWTTICAVDKDASYMDGNPVKCAAPFIDSDEWNFDQLSEGGSGVVEVVSSTETTTSG